MSSAETTAGHDFFDEVRDDELPGDGLSSQGHGPHEHLDDDIHGQDHIEDARAAEAKPKKSRRLLFIVIAAVLGLTVTAVVAVLFLFPSQPKRVQPVVPTVAAEPAAETVQLMDHGASAAQDAAAVAAVSEAASSAAQSVSGSVATTTDPSLTQVQPQARTLAATVAAVGPNGATDTVSAGANYASAESVQTLSEEVRRLRVSVDALMVKRGEASAGRASASTVVHSSQASRTSRARGAVKDKDIVTEKAGETRLSADLPRSDFGREPHLVLRGVYPPQGADQQAWVVDGDRVIVVAKGDRVRGATVVNVSADVVKTTLGDIRY